MAQDSKLRPSEMALLHLSERREERFKIPFEIEVSGIDRNGRVFHFRLWTQNVSEWGCAFLCPQELRKDEIIALRRVDDHASEDSLARFQVVRSERCSDGWQIGVWKMDQDDLWGVELQGLAKPDECNIALHREGESKE